MHGVSKRYGDVQAVSDATLEIELGRIHAIVGENGAGKSTLLAIAAGIATPDRGHVEIGGKRLEPHTPAAGIRAGVGMVAQHFSLVPPLTVLENMMLGVEPTSALGIVDRAAARRRANAILQELGVNLDLDAKTETLGVGDKQRLEIARILFRDAKIVILDEPTAVLAPQEADALYAMLGRLARGGRAIVVVTHKLGEVHAHADAVTVMRRGKIVGTRDGFRDLPKADVTRDLLREVMGGEPPNEPAHELRAFGADVLIVDALVIPPRLRGATLRVRAGEIVGVCGIEGSGQDELVLAIAGLARASAGSVRTPGTNEPAIVFADRHRQGLVLEASVEDNAILGEHASFVRGILLDASRIKEQALARIARAKVVPRDPEMPAGALSGGNQQKLVVERACSRADGKSVRVLVVHHPTRGVDVGAAISIHERILEVATRGVGVLALGSDIEELRSLCDRLLVMARGRIAGEVPRDASQERIGELMLGAVP